MKTLLAFAFAAACVMPVFVFAQEEGRDVFREGYSSEETTTQTTTTGSSASVSNPTGSSATVSNPPAPTTSAPSGTGQTNATKAATKLENPLGDKVKSIPDFIFLVVNFVYSLSYAVIAVFLIISGFKFVMAQGKPDALDDAKATFKYTVIGAILLISANVITEVVRSVINQFVNTPI